MADNLNAQQLAAVRSADTPWTIVRKDWKAVLKQTWADSGKDNIGLIAAGTAFWGFASIAPLLGAIVLSYGLFATPEIVAANIRELFGVLPRDAAALISDQLKKIVGTSGHSHGWALALALLLALYGSMQGASALVTALNVAYEEKETRGFFRLNFLALAVTGAAIVLAIAAAACTAVTAFMSGLIPNAPVAVLTGIRVFSYAILAAAAVSCAALLYRYGPDRAHARWVWITPGSLAATALWLLATAIFAFYVANFANYGATYGSLSAVVVLQLWLWLSAYIFLLGAELNSQLERRTGQDTTTGPPRSPGERGAAVADMIGG